MIRQYRITTSPTQKKSPQPEGCGGFNHMYPNQLNQLFPDSGKSGHDAEHGYYCEDEAVMHVADDLERGKSGN